MILYFSGTGNSKHIAKIISDDTNDILVSLNQRIKENDLSDINVNGRLIIVTPTYAWRIPRIVYNHLLKTRLSNVTNVYYVMTCGSEIGAAGKYNKDLCDLKNLKYSGTIQVVMPENYIAMFNAPNKNEAKEIIAKAETKLKPLLVKINNNEKIIDLPNTLTNRALSLINSSFYLFFVKDKKFYVHDNCIHCGICEKLCPMNNIKLLNGKPSWNGNCTHCMACMNHCPSEAIEYGKISVGKPRYHID